MEPDVQELTPSQSRDLIWQLVSSDGWNSIACLDTRQRDVDDRSRLIVTVIVRGAFWATDESIGLTEHFHVQILQAVVVEKRLQHLHKRLSEWLEFPTDFAYGLETGYRLFRIALGKRVGIICSTERPVSVGSHSEPTACLSSTNSSLINRASV